MGAAGQEEPYPVPGLEAVCRRPQLHAHRAVTARGDQPEMRTVADRSGGRVVYVNSGFAPAYWGGFGYGGPMLTGFLLGEALATPPVITNDYGYGDGGYPGGFGGGDDGGGDFGGGDSFGGGDFGGGDNYGGGGF